MRFRAFGFSGSLGFWGSGQLRVARGLGFYCLGFRVLGFRIA